MRYQFTYTMNGHPCTSEYMDVSLETARERFKMDHPNAEGVEIHTFPESYQFWEVSEIDEEGRTITKWIVKAPSGHRACKWIMENCNWSDEPILIAQSLHDAMIGYHCIRIELGISRWN